MRFEIELSDVEVKALAFVMSDPVAWTQNAISERARIAIDAVVVSETERMLMDPSVTVMPSSKEEIVMAAVVPLVELNTLPVEG